MRPGDWYCPKCNGLIFKNKTFCYKCKVDKHGKQLSNNDSSNNMRPGDWNCPKCNGHIFKSKQFCYKCKVDKHGKQSFSLSTGDWNCSKCGDHQFARNQQCRMCKTPRDKSDKSDKSYNQNSSSVTSNVAVRPGDWLCPKCGDHQFANNVNCRKCYTQNPNLSTQTITSVDNVNSDDNSCSICLDKPKCMLLLHENQEEGHMCCCQDCADKLIQLGQSCPMCRQPVKQAIKVY